MRESSRLPSWRLPGFAIAALLVVVGGAYYLWLNFDSLVGLLKFSAAGLLLVLVLAMGIVPINGVLNTVMVRGLGSRLSHLEGFLMAGAASLANLLPLPGGVIARGVYLKEKFSVPFTHYLSASVALMACSVSVNGLIAVAILAHWFYFPRSVVPWPLWLAFGLMAASGLVFAVPIPRGTGLDPRLRWVTHVVEGWRLMTEKRALLAQLMGLQMLLLFAISARYWAVFRMLSQDLTPGQAYLLAAASILTQAVNIAPGGLGVNEAIVGSLAIALGFDTPAIIAALALDRVATTIPRLLIGIPSTMMLGARMSRHPDRPADGRLQDIDTTETSSARSKH